MNPTGEMPQYTAVEITLIIAALGAMLGTFVAAIGGAIVSIRNSGRLEKVDAKTNEIAVKVDGTASAASAKIDALQREVANLEASNAEKKEAAALLAQAAVQSHASPLSDPLPVTVENGEARPVPTTTKIKPRHK